MYIGIAVITIPIISDITGRLVTRERADTRITVAVSVSIEVPRQLALYARIRIIDQSIAIIINPIAYFHLSGKDTGVIVFAVSTRYDIGWRR